MFLEPKTPKSKCYIAIPDFLYDEIQDYMISLYEQAPDERIFYLTKHALEAEMKRKSIAASLPRIRVHDLRHPYVKAITKLI